MILAAVAVASATLVAGCAIPRREAKSSHVIERFDNRPDGLISREEWTDVEAGGGWFFGTDPQVSTMVAIHTNQSALGGGSVFTAGSLSSSIDTNLANDIGATGTAVGNVVGAAAKAAVK